MSAVRSRLLFIGQWEPALVEKWGAEHQVLPPESITSDIIVLDPHMLKNELLEIRYPQWKSVNSHLQILAVINGRETFDELLSFCQRYEVKQLISNQNSPELETALVREIEKNQEYVQNEQLSFLQSKESEKLLSLQNELEARVEKRTRFLSETRRKLFVSHERMDAFQRLLVQLPKISSLLDLEKLLNESLSRILEIQWIKILLHPEDENFLQEIRLKVNYQVHRLTFYDRNEKAGSLFLMASEARAFSREETDFLNQVTEVIALKIESLSEFERLQTLKQQWQKTFESIPEPLILVGRDFHVLQSNRETSASGRKCFDLLWGRSQPCENCQMGKVFQLKNQKSIWEVLGQPLEEDRIFVHFYRDVTAEIDLQKRRIETSRLVEMGTISSSLAHELNNPLAGLLTFSQMLRLDLKDDDPIKKDVIEIEKAVLKCRDIVQNMLIYARDPGLDPMESVDLVSLLQKFVKILEIPSRSKGLKIKALLSDKPIYFETRQTWLLSVWKSLGLLALSSLEQARKQDPQVRSEIIVSLSESAQELQWNLEVDAPLNNAPEAESVISNFEKILKELASDLTFERVHGRGTRAKITFKRDSRLARKP